MFRDVLNRIGPFLARETMTEYPISPELGLVLWLYPLGHCHNLYTIAEIAGLGVSTVFLLSSITSPKQGSRCATELPAFQPLYSFIFLEDKTGSAEVFLAPQTSIFLCS